MDKNKKGGQKGNQNAKNPLSLRSIAALEGISHEGLRKRLIKSGITLNDYVYQKIKPKMS